LRVNEGMTVRLALLILVFATLRASADPSCACETRDPGKGQRKTALIVSGAALGLWGSAFAVSMYERSQYNAALERRDQTMVYEEKVDAVNDANHAQRVAKYVGTGLFAAGSITLGIAVYLYVTAPDKEIVKTAIVPTAGQGGAGLALIRAF